MTATATAPVWNTQRGYFDDPDDPYEDYGGRLVYRGGKPGADLSRIRKPTRGHKFGPDLVCECGASWAEDQANPTRCGYDWGQNLERKGSISALCRQRGITRGMIAQRAGVSTRVVQFVFVGADDSASKVTRETTERVVEAAVLLLYEDGFEVHDRTTTPVEGISR